VVLHRQWRLPHRVRRSTTPQRQPVPQSISAASAGRRVVGAMQARMNSCSRSPFIRPPFVGVGEAGTVLTVYGAGFNASSKIVIDGVERPTTFVSAIELRTVLTAADVATVTNRDVRVTTSTLPPVTLRVIEQVHRAYLPLIRR